LGHRGPTTTVEPSAFESHVASNTSFDSLVTMGVPYLRSYLLTKLATKPPIRSSYRAPAEIQNHIFEPTVCTSAFRCDKQSSFQLIHMKGNHMSMGL